MNSNIQVFNYQDFTVRTFTDENGTVWFVAKDVAEALEYSNTRDAIQTHVDEEDRRTVSNLDESRIATPLNGLPANTVIINESGVYALIFGSNLPVAKKFKHWVTSVVLPQIHKTGSYSINDSKPVITEDTREKHTLPAHSGGIKAAERLAVRAFKCKKNEDFEAVIAIDRDFADAFGYSWLDRHGLKLRSKMVEATPEQKQAAGKYSWQDMQVEVYYWEHDYNLSEIAARNNDDDNDTVNFDEWSY